MVDENISILIGNGFNHALKAVDSDIYVELDYQSIIDRMLVELNKDEPSKNIINYFKEKNEFDVEKILYNLCFIGEFAQIFKTSKLGDIQEHQYKKLAAQAKEIHDSLQCCFINALGKNHPSYSSIISGDKLDVVCKNLSSFQNIFTINFDLILYWLILYVNKSNKDYFKDKFTISYGKLKLANQFNYNIKALNEWNFIYLHGGIHLLKNLENNSVLKLKNNSEYGNLLKMYKNMKKMSDKFESHLVFGKTCADKRSIIANSPYLTMAMNQLKRYDGELIVYGCKPCSDSSDFNDQHLWENIIYSNIKKVYLGLVLESDKDSVKKYIECRNDKMQVTFFDAITYNIWRDENFIDKVIA